ncbi:MAG: thioredoxin family protein [Candidatus Aenigmarchaeota archaeon]|nr:thioredoxin family protein [Candidatus Aenigmarchaeota archaeon]
MKLFAFALLAIVAVAGCTSAIPGGVQGDVVQDDGTILKPDGTMIKPDGTMVKPDGTMIKPDGTMIKPDGTMVKPNGVMVLPDGTMVAPEGTTLQEDGTIVKPDGTMVKPDGTMVAPDGTVTPPPAASADYTGELIAGSTTPYLRYTKADFDQALADGKAVYVYVYATWCPICAAERPNILATFDGLELTNAVGFESHWNDGQNNQDDAALAQTYGVAYQHTHLFIRPDGTLSSKAVSALPAGEIESRLIAAGG